LVALPDIRKNERRNVLGAFLTLFGVLSAHVIAETARDALFLGRLPAEQLPWVYLAIAVAAAMVARPRAGAREVGRRLLGGWLLASAAINVAFWVFATPDRPWTLYLLYTWSGVFGTLTLTWFWLLLGELFTVTEAKRLYGVIGAGAVLGAVAGSGLASQLARHLPAEHLLLASAAVLALTAAVPTLVLRRPEDAPSRRPPLSLPEVRECMRTVVHTPYIRRLALLVIVSTLTLSVVDYVFKATVAAEVPREELGAWFASFYLGLNTLALLAQILLTGAVMRRLGVHRALLLLPLLLLGGAATFFVIGGLLGAVVLKGADAALRHSLHRTSTELLFLPISERLRRHSKAFIDVLLQRSAQAAASVLILGAVALGAGTLGLVAVAAAFAVLWLAVAMSLRPHYVEMFRASLRGGMLASSRDVRDFDLNSLEALIRALNQGDNEVVAAMEILAREGRTNLIPALILYHPSEDVVLRALDLFAKARTTEFVPVADRLLASDTRPNVRAAALRARHAVAPDPERLRAFVDDPSSLLSTVACASLIASGALDDDEVRSTLASLPRGDSAEEHVAILTEIALQPLPLFEPLVLELAASPDRHVRLAAAEAMGAIGSEAMLPPLVAMLGENALRLRSRAALVRHGKGALAYLRGALADESLPDTVRLHLPRTISRFCDQEAADILMERLLEEPRSAVRFKILRGLGRLRADDRGLHLDRRVLREAVSRDIDGAFALTRWHHELVAGAARDPTRDTTGHELLTALVQDKEIQALERIFRLLGLMHRDEDFEPIYRSMRGGSRVLRAHALELLEYVIDADLRGSVMALVSDLPFEQRMVAGGARASAPGGYEGLLRELAAGDSSTLASIARYHARELGLGELPEGAPDPAPPDRGARRQTPWYAALLPKEPDHA
jgi:ATP/ADP translocase/HEAT repeat protein